MLDDFITLNKDLTFCLGDLGLWFYSALTEMLPKHLTDAINKFLEQKGEEIARTDPEINIRAWEYAFDKESKRSIAEAKMTPEQRAKWNPIPLPDPTVCIALFHMRREWGHKYQNFDVH